MHGLNETYPELAAAIVDSFDTFGEDSDEYGIHERERIQEIEHNSRSGFIPFTNGGYRLMVLCLLDSHYNATGRHAEIIAPYVESTENDAARDFIDARGQDTDPETLGARLAADWEDSDSDSAAAFIWDWFHAREAEHSPTVPLFPELPPVQFWQTPAGILQSEFHEYLTEYMSEGGDYWLELRAHWYAADNPRNESGRDELTIMAGVNTDFTYGRDKGLDITFERTFPADRLTADRLRVIIEAAAASIEK